jgi:hypothetical protein
MKTITFIEIEKSQIITSIENASIDPEETNKAVEIIIEKNPNILLTKTRESLLSENVKFAKVGYGQKNVDDTEGEKLKDLFASLEPHEKLCLSGKKISDLRDTEYLIKKAGIWEKEKIEHLGEALPANAVLPDKLSQIQQKEIAEQTEKLRIANLTPEQKAEEKEAALSAVKREVRNLKEEAEIADESFDSKAEYQKRKAKIDEKYS